LEAKEPAIDQDVGKEKTKKMKKSKKGKGKKKELAEKKGLLNRCLFCVVMNWCIMQPIKQLMRFLPYHGD